MAAAGVERSAYSLGDAFVSVIDAATGGTIRFAGAPAGSHVVSMAMAPDGRTLAVAAKSPDYTSGTVWLWDVVDRRLGSIDDSRSTFPTDRSTSSRSRTTAER